ADVVPQPRRRPLSAQVAGKPARDLSKSSSSASTRLSAAKPVKRKRKRHTDLPPFLRPLFD
ncbi:MAG TPA: extensin, partial [Nitrobacter sp.]|nr:extensin [Nitrobacter sp.]